MNRVANPPNRFDPVHVDYDADQAPVARVRVIEDDSRGVISTNRSPDVRFDHAVNPYRGCTHACAYCYARPTHEYLGLGAGTDFERVIHVKRRAPDLLREALCRPGWRGQVLAFSGVTDAWQPLERRYGLTRACLEVCAEFRNPVEVITRAPLVLRDLDLLRRLAEHDAVCATISLPLLDPALQRALEPGAPRPSARLRAIRGLAEAGIPVGVSVSPVIPGLNDRLMPATLQAAREAGATFAVYLVLRLPGAVATVFEERLHRRLPDRADTVMARIVRARGGRLNEPRFGERMRGSDTASQATAALFRVWHRRLGFGPHPDPPDPSPFRVPGRGLQLDLFR